MQNFTFVNPTKIIFGEGSIAELKNEYSAGDKILMTYGGGSIKKNGVYEQVIEALEGFDLLEFGGIEANPRFETLMKAVELARKENVTHLLAVGGGSIIDGTKFIAAAIPFDAGREWDILAQAAPLETAIPFGSVLTLPATGSEMNCASVVSREETNEKLVFINPLVFPVFSILDPVATYTLPERQTANGIVDTFIHVTEQYLTYPVNAHLQDRQAEAILLTLVDEGPKAIENPGDYDTRATIMWCSTQALNGNIGCGVPQDWGTHLIGHELTALHGIDHARTLAIVLPGMLSYRSDRKKDKIIQYGERIWNITEGSEEERIEAAIRKTKEFFNSMGIPTSLADYKIAWDGVKTVGERIDARDMKLGEHGDIGGSEIDAILKLCL